MNQLNYIVTVSYYLIQKYHTLIKLLIYIETYQLLFLMKALLN